MTIDVTNDRPPVVEVAPCAIDIVAGVPVEAKTARAVGPRYRLDLYKLAVWIAGIVLPWSLIALIAMASFVRHP
jgi:hypothetical protein